MRVADCWKIVGLCIAVSGLGGCSIVREYRSFTPPTMTLVGASADAEDASGGVSELRVVRFEVMAENPSARPVPMERVSYTVSRDGQAVFTGERDAQRTIPPMGVMRFTLPAAVPAGMAGEELALSSVVTYRRPGALANTLHELGLVRPSRAVDGAAAAR